MSYSIGIDFGTLSARCVIADVKTGKVVAEESCLYPHGVLSDALPDGTRLPDGYALQVPDDYLFALKTAVSNALASSAVDPKEIIGIGLDATSCTILPLDKEGKPLANDPRFQKEPQAYMKMWKHHGASAYAEKLTAAAKKACPELLSRFGGNISAESLFPRLWEMQEEAPELFKETKEVLEAADWIVAVLTGNCCRGACAAGYKAYYHPKTGYASSELFRAAGIDGEVFLEKLPSPVRPVGQMAGSLRADMSRELGLPEGIPVATGMVDAHACVPACGIAGEGQLLLIIGTSTCQMLLSKKDVPVPGICGAVPGGILPGFVGYEAGQTSVGDMFAYFIDHYVPEATKKAADAAGWDLHTYLSKLASLKEPGGSGLIALDWLNGNRSPFCDYDLSGLLIGVSMDTRPEDVYRALLESTAFGCRRILENFVRAGLKVEKVLCSGGISQKNPFAMQLYADILGRPIEVVELKVGPAHGSAVFGAVAAGKNAGGYNDVEEAILAMGCRERVVYQPIPSHVKVYEELFFMYNRLGDLFAKEETVMHDLKRLKRRG